MVLNTFALLFVLGLTFLHSMWGLFSGILNVFCAITALCVAFGFLEPVNDLVTGSLHLHSSYSEPLVLVVLFVVTLVVLRLLSDNYIRGNVRVPMYLDWAGGGVAGFVHAQICVGVMVTGFLMLPWGGRVMMLQSITRDPDNNINPDTGRVEFRRSHLWLRSDEFAVGLFKMISGGALRGETTFAEVYPDYTQWVAWTGNQVQPESLTSPLRDASNDGFKDGLSVDQWWELKDAQAQLASDDARYRKGVPNKGTPVPPYDPLAYKSPTGRLIAVRLVLGAASADREKEYGHHRFRPTLLRLVGDVTLPDGTREPKDYVAQLIGGVDSNLGDKVRVADPDNNFSLPATGKEKLDAYFEVDPGFEPRFVEYRRHARAALVAATKKEHAPTRLAAAAAPGKEGGGAQGHGVARFMDTVVKSGESIDLPFRMVAEKLRSNGTDLELKNGQYESGRVTGAKKTLEDGKEYVDKFVVPEGKKLFQIQTHTRKMESIVGQALNFAASTTNQYVAIDRVGEKHKLCGYYAIVKRGEDQFIEMYYVPAPDDVGYSGLLNFSDSSIRRELRDQEEAILGLIFVVPPGTCITKIQSQGGSVDFGSEICVGG